MNTIEKADYIVNWIREYAKSAGMESLICGVSGGVDSALVSTLCAMTGIKTCCVRVPINSSRQQIQFAYNHIYWLNSQYQNITYANIDLSETFRSFKKNTSYPYLQS